SSVPGATVTGPRVTGTPPFLGRRSFGGLVSAAALAASRTLTRHAATATLPGRQIVAMETGSVHDHRPRDLTLLHRLERIVDVVQLDATRDQLVDLELAAHVEIDELRHVAPHVGRAVERSDQRLLLQRQHDARHGDVEAEPRHPDHHRLAAAFHREESLRDDRGRADHLEGVVYAEAASQLLDGRGHLRSTRGVDQVGGTELLRQLELRLREVDADDARRPAQRGALDAVQADAAAAEDRDRLAGLHLGGVDHRPDAGHHPTADQAGTIERDVVGYL